MRKCKHDSVHVVLYFTFPGLQPLKKKKTNKQLITGFWFETLCTIFLQILSLFKTFIQIIPNLLAFCQFMDTDSILMGFYVLEDQSK